MKYFASCSFGKDSVATVLLAIENNEPLDGILFNEIVFDHKRNISGEIPEHIEWVYNVAIPTFERMGVPTKVIKSEKDYMYFFTNTVGGEVQRQTLRFSVGWTLRNKPRLQGRSDKEVFAHHRRRIHAVHRYSDRRAEKISPAER